MIQDVNSAFENCIHQSRLCRHPLSSSIRIVLLDIKGGTRNVPQSRQLAATCGVDTDCPMVRSKSKPSTDRAPLCVTDQFTALLALGAILSTSLTTATAARYFTAFYKNYIAVYKPASLCTSADDVRQRSDGDHAHIAQVLFLRLCRAYEKQ